MYTLEHLEVAMRPPFELAKTRTRPTRSRNPDPNRDSLNTTCTFDMRDSLRNERKYRMSDVLTEHMVPVSGDSEVAIWAPADRFIGRKAPGGLAWT